MDASLVPALEDVMMVARTGSVGQAARQLHKTPSAVSQQIRRVEEHFGAELFERVGRGIRPNANGEAALLAIRRLFDEVLGAFDLLSSLGGRPTTTLRIAASDYLGKALLVPVLRELLAEGAPLRFAIVSANSFESARLVEEGEVDFAVVTRPASAARGRERSSRPGKASRGATLRERTLFRQPFFWVGPRTPPPARDLLDRLATEPLLRLSPGSQGRRLLDQLLDRTRVQPLSTIDVSGVGLLVSYVAGGVGIGLAPALSLFDVRGARVAVERAETPPLPVVLVYRERLEGAAGVAPFIERLVAQGARAERRITEELGRATHARPPVRPTRRRPARTS